MNSAAELRLRRSNGFSAIAQICPYAIVLTTSLIGLFGLTTVTYVSRRPRLPNRSFSGNHGDFKVSSHVSEQGAIDMSVITTASGLKYEDANIGAGAQAKSGDKVHVHYVGRLENNDMQFDSSRTRDKPFEFVLGVGQVIKGWDEGVAGMRVGGQRTLTIPSKLAYDRDGIPGVVPPNAALIFDIELIAII
jgi:FKBP-type peptidyl-prolyl cis-trans isomerase FkpA